MRIVVTEYPVYNLWVQRPFELDGYAFTPAGGMAGYQERIRQVLASPEDVHTVDVERTAEQGTQPDAGVLIEGGNALDDWLALLSLAQGRSVHYREARWTVREGEGVVSRGVNRSYTGRELLRGEQAVSPFEVEPFLRTATERVRRPEWLDTTAFASGLFWYLDSLGASVHEVRYLAAWRGLMALVRRYFQGRGEGQAGGRTPAELVLAFRDAHEHDFILDEHPPIWEELHNDFVFRHPKDRFFTSRHAYIYARKLQLVLVLALLDMAGTRDFARRGSLLRDIRR